MRRKNFFNNLSVRSCSFERLLIFRKSFHVGGRLDVLQMTPIDYGMQGTTPATSPPFAHARGRSINSFGSSNTYDSFSWSSMTCVFNLIRNVRMLFCRAYLPSTAPSNRFSHARAVTTTLTGTVKECPKMIATKDEFLCAAHPQPKEVVSLSNVSL